MHFCVSKKCNYGKHYSPWRETHVVKQVLHSQFSAAQDLRPDIATWTEISWDICEIYTVQISCDILLEQATFESLNRDKLGYMWDIMLRYYWDILLEQATFEIIERRVRTSCCIWWRLALWRSPPACCWACEWEGDQETAETAHRCPPYRCPSHRCPPSQSFFEDW